MSSRRVSIFVAGAVALATALSTLGTTGCSDLREFSAEDEARVRDAVQAYVKAWLANDADAVMATLTEDIVLQPHHGDDPVVGAEAVRAWWFPGGAPTVITEFSVETQAVSGYGSLAYAWGRSFVAWEAEGRSYSNEGNALSILRKGSDGSWRIAHQIWNDPPSTVQ